MLNDGKGSKREVPFESYPSTHLPLSELFALVNEQILYLGGFVLFFSAFIQLYTIMEGFFSLVVWFVSDKKESKKL